MFNKKLIIAAMMMACIFTMTSCFGPKKMAQRRIPTAINTVNSVRLEELNLKHGSDYTIVTTITADATVIYSEQKKGEQITMKEENDEFKMVLRYDTQEDEWRCTDFEGIARFGYLTNDYGNYHLSSNPEYVARNLAIYRLINASKVRGADGVIEPVISTNAEQRGKEIVFKTTVSAKLIKLKTDAK